VLLFSDCFLSPCSCFQIVFSHLALVFRLFSLCEWGNDDVLEWGADVGQMYRVQMDHLRECSSPAAFPTRSNTYFSNSTSAFWHFPPKAAGQGLGQGTGDIIEYMASLQPSTRTRRYGWLDPDFLMTECCIFHPLSFARSRAYF
jgi:hypothetical protein